VRCAQTSPLRCTCAPAAAVPRRSLPSPPAPRPCSSCSARTWTRSARARWCGRSRRPAGRRHAPCPSRYAGGGQVQARCTPPPASAFGPGRAAP
jgi:hypothetical protein